MLSSKILVLISILYEGCLLKLERIPDNFSQQKKSTIKSGI